MPKPKKESAAKTKERIGDLEPVPAPPQKCPICGNEEFVNLNGPICNTCGWAP